jgi:hypothetical protein
MPRHGSRLAALCTVCTLLLVGCQHEKLPEFGQVTGTVTAKGKPLKGIIVTFMPDPTKGNDNPFNATGKTDAQGKYQLRHAFKGHEGEGAPVGWNRVIVIDTRYGSIPQGAPLPPPLFSSSYSAVTSTPLKFEVKPGPQTIDLDLK